MSELTIVSMRTLRTATADRLREWAPAMIVSDGVPVARVMPVCEVQVDLSVRDAVMTYIREKRREIQAQPAAGALEPPMTQERRPAVED